MFIWWYRQFLLKLLFCDILRIICRIDFKQHHFSQAKKAFSKISSCGYCYFMYTLKAFDSKIGSNKIVQSNVFWYVKVCIFWKCIQYTIHWDKKQMLQRFPLEKINSAKMLCFLFRELQLIIVLLLICDAYMSWSTWFISPKLWVGFSIFDSVLFLLKFTLFFNKMHELSDFETSWLLSKLKW